MKILLVEDEPALRALLAASLQRDFASEVVEAHHGVEALKLLRTDASFDLLITDVRMPFMDGVQLAREVGERLPSLPVLYISGFASPDELPAPAAFLEKPFSRDQFLAKVRDVVQAPRTGESHRP